MWGGQSLAELYCQKAMIQYFYNVSMGQNAKIHLEAPRQYILPYTYYTFCSGDGDSFKALYF